jgi:hypothetical protein
MRQNTKPTDEEIKRLRAIRWDERIKEYKQREKQNYEFRMAVKSRAVKYFLLEYGIKFKEDQINWDSMEVNAFSFVWKTNKTYMHDAPFITNPVTMPIKAIVDQDWLVEYEAKLLERRAYQEQSRKNQAEQKIRDMLKQYPELIEVFKDEN